MNVPRYYWGEAVLTASYLINRLPTKILKYSTPLECFQKVFPLSRMYSDLLKVFGCIVFVHLPNHNRSNLDLRAEKCVFIRYASNKKGYKCYSPQTRKIYVSMDVSFIEDKSLFDKIFLVSFIEDKSFFDKNSLQEENDVMEEFFWDLSLAPLPNTILTTPSLIYNPEEQCDKTNNLEDQFDKSDKNSSHIVPNITVFEIGGASGLYSEKDSSKESKSTYSSW